mgnify:CR=1 FL=1
MKAIVCLDCYDVIGLSPHEERKCFCGKSGGEYLYDGHHAHVFGPCFVLGISTPDLYKTMVIARGATREGTVYETEAKKTAEAFGWDFEESKKVRCWAMIPDERRVIRVPAPVQKIPRVRQRKGY